MVDSGELEECEDPGVMREYDAEQGAVQIERQARKRAMSTVSTQSRQRSPTKELTIESHMVLRIFYCFYFMYWTL